MLSGGTWPGQLILTDQMNTPYHRTPYPVYRVGRGKKVEREIIGVTLSSQVTIACDGALLTWGWLPAHGK